ncbi:MAG TPA: ABC transporter permease [Clostridia bacterium]|nr:ABC transporter permease [Clostridia bacterium]
MAANSIQKKAESLFKSSYYPLISILMALLGGGIIISALGFSPIDAYRALIKGSFGNANAIGETLVKASPLIFTGLSYAIAKRCGIINLGAEGQLYAGALTGTLVGTALTGLPMAIHLPLAIAAGFLGGAIFGMLVGVLKTRFGASELITTIMLNYIAVSFISFCVTGPMKDTAAGSFPQSKQILASARFPHLMEGSRLHAGIFVVILALLFYYFFMWRTTRGYQMRVIGLNSTAGHYAGMNLKTNSILSMFLAGGMAGIGGSMEIMAVQFRLLQDFSSNYGFDGIAVALLGNNSPIGIALSGILFGALRSGSGKMQMLAQVPSAVIYMIQGFIILFVIGREMFNLSKLIKNKKQILNPCNDETVKEAESK